MSLKIKDENSRKFLEITRTKKNHQHFPSKQVQINICKTVAATPREEFAIQIHLVHVCQVMEAAV